ncbi:protoporphyrinogen oxidase isoform X4 [Melopsittacus undulatus]|uniref:protoporphyrinogen oxidase isoform X4 n=1 Tax=Melopsittacus undulatus TaxID=13146 RepID=UPI00146DB4B6|nr:protoporphyrinogen oxidase isoform X4 [Melopsittacus undulatus]
MARGGSGPGGLREPTPCTWCRSSAWPVRSCPCPGTTRPPGTGSCTWLGPCTSCRRGWGRCCGRCRRSHGRCCGAASGTSWHRQGRNRTRASTRSRPVASVGRLFQAERSRRSVLLGLALGSGDGNGAESGLSRRARTERWSQWSLRGGMETLPQALAEFLRERGVELRCHQRLQSLRRCHHGGWELTLTDGTVTADHVVSALPAAALAEVLPAEAAALAQELRHIPAVSVAVVNLQYKDVTLPVTGFGHLVPSSEDGSLLGIVYDSVAFPEHNGTGAASLRLTVMLGGAWFEQSFGDPATVAPELLLHRAQAAVREQLGLEPAPTHSIVRVHQACIPQYTLGHWQRTGKWVLRSGGAPDAPSPVPSTHPGPTERISRFLAEHHLPLSLIGASYSGVSVNDCIASAKAAVERLLGPRH